VRKFLIAVAVLLGVIFLIGQFAEVQAVVETLQKGDVRYLLFAFIIQVFWLVNVSASYYVIYRLLRI
jgi:hypothetical protein